MAALGALGIGLSIVFGGFVLVLLAELYYVFFWKRYRRVNSVATDYNAERGNFAHEAALVGSFGGYSGCAMDAEFVAKLFPMGPHNQPVANDNLYMHGVFGDPRLLFTIKEETKEDLELEEAAKAKAKANAKENAKAYSSPKLSPELLPSPKQLQQQQQQAQLMHFSYSIGLIQQPKFSRPILQSSASELAPSPRKNFSQSSNDSSPVNDSSSSSSSSAGRHRRSVSTSPSGRSSSGRHRRSASTSPSRQTFSACGSPGSVSVSVSSSVGSLLGSPREETVLESDSPRECELFRRETTGHSSESPQETPFDTPFSSPSLLTPSGTPPFTPPLTPIKPATLDDASARAISMGRRKSGTSCSASSSADSINASFSSSRCSSPSSESLRRNPGFDSGRVPPAPLENPFEKSPQKRRKAPPVVPGYANARSERHNTLMVKRAFVSLFKEPALQTLPRESPRECPHPPRFRSSNGSPCTPFSTAPSTPSHASPSQCPLRDPQAKEAAPAHFSRERPRGHLPHTVSHQ